MLRAFLWILLVFLSGCAEMDEFFAPSYYEEVYEQPAPSCQQPAPTARIAPVPVQPAGGYETQEPPH